MDAVSKDKFFGVINEFDCHPSIEGSWPYTSVFKKRTTRVEVGRIVCSLPRVRGKVQSQYLLP